MRGVKRKRIVGIVKDTIDFILEMCKSNHPKEFIGLLGAEGDVITDVFLLPGTRSSEVNAVIRMDMMPIGLSYVGSVHSHPSFRGKNPSPQDLFMFSRTAGDYHIIAFFPYEQNSWRCYDSWGKERKLEVVDKKEELI
jgi:proteasome lid subunit RPN8/RPN11